VFLDPNSLWLMVSRVSSDEVRLTPSVPLSVLSASLIQLRRCPSSLHAAGISTFGPTPTAAQMEGSKAFSKDFMARHAIPTAAFKTFKAAQFEEAKKYAKECGHRVVLKADGLAGGKGVLIPESWEETEQGLKEVMVDKVFGDAGEPLIHMRE
jgi:phosphoribosylamine-glycine ligase